MRFFLLFSLLVSLLFSREAFLYPTACCPAYNNLKHTKNSGNIHLDTAKRYKVNKHHKGQYLIQVKDASPTQRWVDESCLAPKSKLYVAPVKCEVVPIAKKEQKHADTPLQNLLALSWHNAFCETHRSKKECNRGWKQLFSRGKVTDNFTLHGLWPQPKNRVYCGVERRYITADKYGHWNKLPEPKLNPEIKTALQKVMPGVVSNLHRHEWIKHGTCYGTDAQTYFEDAVKLTEAVRHSSVADFFRKNTGKRVTLSRVRELFDNTFGKGAGSHVELRCKQGMITEIWLHLGRGGESLNKMLKEGKKVHSRCQRGIIDKAGYQH